MRFVRALFISFSMYSRIPVPQFAWREEDMKYALCFFPWVGAVIGGLVCLWERVAEACGAGELCRVLVGASIPILVTGGIHADGFMDTMDAFRSFQTRERKLEIMKDPHIGTFSVLALAFCGAVYLSAFSEIRDEALLKILCAGFVLARCLSGIGAVTFRPAREDGLLFAFADSADKRNVRYVLSAQTLLCMGYMMRQSFWVGCIVPAAAFGTFAYYGFRCRKELGGITGDTAGWFLVICEGSMAAACALWNMLF